MLCILQLEDGHTLFDYDVGLNDLIQLMIRIKPALAADAPATLTMPARAEPKDGAEDHFSDKENNEVHMMFFVNFNIFVL